MLGLTLQNLRYVFFKTVKDIKDKRNASKLFRKKSEVARLPATWEQELNLNYVSLHPPSSSLLQDFANTVTTPPLHLTGPPNVI